MRRALIIALSAAGALGCSAEPDAKLPTKQTKATSAKAAPARAPDAYTVKGRLDKVVGKLLHIHHEALPGFKGPKGKVIGMKSMTMPFTLAEGATSTAKAGDRVEIKFTMSYVSQPQLVVQSITTLPPGKLAFE